MHTGNASTPAKCLNSSALPSITGIAASGPMSPRPSTAVPSDTIATVFFLIVYSCAAAGFFSISRHTRATPGVYAIDRSSTSRTGREAEHLDLAALVHLEGPVLELEDLDALERLEGGTYLVLVGLAAAVDHEVLVQARGLHLEALRAPRCCRRPRRSRSRPCPSIPGSLTMRTRTRTEYAGVGVSAI